MGIVNKEQIDLFLQTGFSGSGYGSGTCYGSGDGSGYGYGYGFGCGSGYGDGYGYGFGYAPFSVDGDRLYKIDGVPTVILSLHGDFAKGYIFRTDLQKVPCFIAKQDGVFAHGATLRDAVQALQEKIFEDEPLEERIAQFVKDHKPGTLYPNRDYFRWHHILTGSCEIGRLEFAKEHGIDLDSSMTPEEFIDLTQFSYGGKIIQSLKPYYA